MRATPGRMIIGTFASQVERIIAVIKMAEEMNKKVAIEGRSMKTNLEIIIIFLYLAVLLTITKMLSSLME
jgi:ribonuclease J